MYLATETLDQLEYTDLVSIPDQRPYSGNVGLVCGDSLGTATSALPTRGQ